MVMYVLNILFILNMQNSTAIFSFAQALKCNQPLFLNVEKEERPETVFELRFYIHIKYIS